ncbi:amidohydrolase family protein [Acetobacteraceae bacterium H6797]|nr:amidohydrolase family protein [Acetobacteraceae bacterium H6797]
MRDLPIIDAHHHFWAPTRNDHPWLNPSHAPIPFRYGDYSAMCGKDFLPPDYDALTSHHRIVASVTMEGEWNPDDPTGESRWMADLAARTGRPAGHVAQAWLDRADVAQVLEEQAALPLVKGVRHKPRATRGPGTGEKGSMSEPTWREGYARLAPLGLHFELQTPWWHLGEAADLISAFPDTMLVLNHTGLPSDRSPEGLAGWRAAMRRLAEAPQARVKISGLGLAGRPWRIEENIGIIRDTIEIFGVARCMFASNFPVDGLCGSFETIFDGFRQSVADLPWNDQLALFHDNAIRTYRLDIPLAAGADA